MVTMKSFLEYKKRDDAPTSSSNNGYQPTNSLSSVSSTASSSNIAGSESSTMNPIARTPSNMDASQIDSTSPIKVKEKIRGKREG